MTGKCNAFQHFLLDIPIRWSLIYQWYLYLIKSTKDNNYYLNITIATNINWSKTDSIHVWFWSQFGFKPGINKIHSNLNVSVINTAGWCAKIDYTWYAPLVIAPYVVDIDANMLAISMMNIIYNIIV